MPPVTYHFRAEYHDKFSVPGDKRYNPIKHYHMRLMDRPEPQFQARLFHGAPVPNPMLRALKGLLADRAEVPPHSVVGLNVIGDPDYFAYPVCPVQFDWLLSPPFSDGRGKLSAFKSDLQFWRMYKHERIRRIKLARVDGRRDRELSTRQKAGPPADNPDQKFTTYDRYDLALARRYRREALEARRQSLRDFKARKAAE